MEHDEVIDELKAAGAFMEGHFILSSGLHSNVYIQCARIFMDAGRGERLCRALADEIIGWMQDEAQGIDIIVAPAMGGVVMGYEMGRQLERPTMFCERVDGQFVLRRGFSLEPGQRVLIAEDVVTTGKSTMETARCIESCGAIPVAVCSLIDRIGSVPHVKTPGLRQIPLISIFADTFPADEVPEALRDVPAVKPGSRFLKHTA